MVCLGILFNCLWYCAVLFVLLPGIVLILSDIVLVFPATAFGSAGHCSGIFGWGFGMCGTVILYVC